jgi:hypothetical protein
MGAYSTQSMQLCYCLFSRKCYPFKICLIRWTCIIKLEVCKFLVFSLFSFLYIQPCRMVGGNQYARGMCCLHLKVTSMIKVPCAVMWETAYSFQKWQLSAKLQGITSQKTVIFPQHLSQSHNISLLFLPPSIFYLGTLQPKSCMHFLFPPVQTTYNFSH